MEGNTPRFAELLGLHITNQINKKFENSTLDPETLHQMRDLVRDQVHVIFKKSSHKVTDDGLNWLANQLFKTFQVTSKSEQGVIEKKPVYELVIFNDYNLAALPYDDIKLLRDLFGHVSYGVELEEEYKKRSAA